MTPIRGWAERIRASDMTALEAFFKAVQPALVRYAAKFVSAESAADVVQDAFVRIWESRERIDPDQSLKAMAYRTVRNLCFNQIRDHKTRSELLEEQAPLVEPSGSGPADADMYHRDFAERLEGWIDELPERQAQALRLSRFEGLSHREIAEVMGVAERTINNHLVRALRSMRDRIGAYDPSLLDLT